MSSHLWRVEWTSCSCLAGIKGPGLKFFQATTHWRLTFAAGHRLALPWSAVQRPSHLSVALKVRECCWDLGAHCPVSCRHFYSTFSLLNLLAVEVPCRSHSSELQTLKLSPPLWQCTHIADWFKQKELMNSASWGWGSYLWRWRRECLLHWFLNPHVWFAKQVWNISMLRVSHKARLRSSQQEGMLMGHFFLNLDPNHKSNLWLINQSQSRWHKRCYSWVVIILVRSYF